MAFKTIYFGKHYKMHIRLKQQQNINPYKRKNIYSQKI